jgi:hypothetical protein
MVRLEKAELLFSPKTKTSWMSCPIEKQALFCRECVAVDGN